MFVKVHCRIDVATTCIITVAHIAIVHRQMGSTEHSTALTAAVCVTLDGWYAAGKSATGQVANHHVGLAGNIAGGTITDAA